MRRSLTGKRLIRYSSFCAGMRTAQIKRRKLYSLSGFLRCADCGRGRARYADGKKVYYYCGTYKNQSKLACTKHTIKHNCLEAAVLYAIEPAAGISGGRLRENHRTDQPCAASEKPVGKAAGYD